MHQTNAMDNENDDSGGNVVQKSDNLIVSESKYTVIPADDFICTNHLLTVITTIAFIKNEFT